MQLGGSEAIEVEADDIPLDYVEENLRSNRLGIKPEKRIDIDPGRNPQYRVTVRDSESPAVET